MSDWRVLSGISLFAHIIDFQYFEYEVTAQEIYDSLAEQEQKAEQAEIMVFNLKYAKYFTKIDCKRAWNICNKIQLLSKIFPAGCFFIFKQK